jgi:uncharacterized protein YcbX
MTTDSFGHVAGLFNYPLKSAAAQAVAEVFVDREGCRGDRNFSLVEEGGKRVTALRHPLLSQLVLEGGDSPHLQYPNGDREVFHAGECLEKLSCILGTRVFAKQEHLLEGGAVSLVNSESVRLVCGELGVEPDARRFRPNILLAPAEGEAFVEEELIGRQFQVGDQTTGVTFTAVELTERCAVVNLDPTTSRVDERFLKFISRNRRGCFGIYMAVIIPGIVRVGDTISLLPHRMLPEDGVAVPLSCGPNAETGNAELVARP